MNCTVAGRMQGINLTNFCEIRLDMMHRNVEKDCNRPLCPYRGRAVEGMGKGLVRISLG